MARTFLNYFSFLSLKKKRKIPHQVKKILFVGISEKVIGIFVFHRTLMMPATRKCSSGQCPAENTSQDHTVNCHRCRSLIHLLCYGIDQKPEAVFVNANVVMMCDECLNSVESSPKRKQPSLVQSTFDTQNRTMTINKPKPSSVTPSKMSENVKQNHQFHTVMQTLVEKVDVQTTTIAGLQASVESMSRTISQHKDTVGESIARSNECMTTIREKLKNTSTTKHANRISYANAVKNSSNFISETPKSSKHSRAPSVNHRTVTGKSNNVIGKPPSPQEPRRINRQEIERAVWISKLHRDTTVQEMEKYVVDTFGLQSTEKIQIRKLVKKDRVLSSYSFVSFSVACTTEIFKSLMDEEKWPSYCEIREFKLDQRMTSIGGKQISSSPKSDSQNLEHDSQSKN